MIGIFMHGLKLLIYKDFLVFETKTLMNLYIPEFYKSLKPLQYKAFTDIPKEAKTVVNKGFQKSTTLVTNKAYELKNRNNEIVQKLNMLLRSKIKRDFFLNDKEVNRPTLLIYCFILIKFIIF